MRGFGLRFSRRTFLAIGSAAPPAFPWRGGNFYGGGHDHEPADVVEGSITAWATFGATMAAAKRTGAPFNRAWDAAIEALAADDRRSWGPTLEQTRPAWATAWRDAADDRSGVGATLIG